MPSSMNYLVMCPKAKARPLSELLPTLKLPSSCEPLLEGETLYLVMQPEGYEIAAVLLTEGYVAIEAMEFAEQFAKDRPDREAIATYDARYQITGSLSEFEETFEVFWILASRLAETCDGVILNSYMGEWVEPF